MTKIRATCPACGNVEFGVHSIVVLGHSTAAGLTAAYSDEGARVASATYRFECPCCERPVLRSAEREIIELLLSVGVPVEAQRVALESLRSDVATLPPFTLADVERMRDALASPDWFSRLHESGR